MNVYADSPPRWLLRFDSDTPDVGVSLLTIFSPFDGLIMERHRANCLRNFNGVTTIATNSH